jgi:hypothetical protein
MGITLITSAPLVSTCTPRYNRWRGGGGGVVCTNCCLFYFENLSFPPTFPEKTEIIRVPSQPLYAFANTSHNSSSWILLNKLNQGDILAKSGR